MSNPLEVIGQITFEADSRNLLPLLSAQRVFCDVHPDGQIVCRVDGREALWFDTESTTEVAAIVRNLYGEHIALGFFWLQGADLDR